MATINESGCGINRQNGWRDHWPLDWSKDMSYIGSPQSWKPSLLKLGFWANSLKFGRKWNKRN